MTGLAQPPTPAGARVQSTRARRRVPQAACAHSWRLGCPELGTEALESMTLCTHPWAHGWDQDIAARSSQPCGGPADPVQPFLHSVGGEQMWPPPVRESSGCRAGLAGQSGYSSACSQGNWKPVGEGAGSESPDKPAPWRLPLEFRLSERPWAWPPANWEG